MYKLETPTSLGGNVTAWTDAFIIHNQDIMFLSMYGRPSEVKSVSAQIMSGYRLNLCDAQGKFQDNIFRRQYGLRSVSAVLDQGKVLHKVMWAPLVFTPWLEGNHRHVCIAFGENEQAAKARLFRTVDRLYDTPLRPQWTDWLWQNMDSFEPTDVYAPRRPEFNVTRCFVLPDYENDFMLMILNGVGNGELH